MKEQQTQTCSQAFCLACNKGVNMPHKCPVTNKTYTKSIDKKSIGI